MQGLINWGAGRGVFISLSFMQEEESLSSHTEVPAFVIYFILDLFLCVLCAVTVVHVGRLDSKVKVTLL